MDIVSIKRPSVNRKEQCWNESSAVLPSLTTRQYMSGERAGCFIEAIQLPPYARLRMTRRDIAGVRANIHGACDHGAEATIVPVPADCEMADALHVSRSPPPFSIEILIVEVGQPAFTSLHHVLPKDQRHHGAVRRDARPSPPRIRQRRAEMCERIRLRPCGAWSAPYPVWSRNHDLPHVPASVG